MSFREHNSEVGLAVSSRKRRMVRRRTGLRGTKRSAVQCDEA
jgi:hypothetical protein